MAKQVIVITGTPGVGKTSVSRMLASKLDADIIEVGELVEKEKLFTGFDEDRGTFIADTDRLSKRIGSLIENSSRRDILVVGHFAVDLLPPDKIHKVFVLRRYPEELRAVLERRGYKGRKLWENLVAEALDVCLCESVGLCGEGKVCEVDVTGRDFEEVVEEIISILEGRGDCRVGVTDWLGRLEAEGKLDEYMKHF